MRAGRPAPSPAATGSASRRQERRPPSSIPAPSPPEALAAWEALNGDLPGLGLLAVTSPDLLHRGWSERRRERWGGKRASPSHVERLLSPLSPSAGLVTLLDAAPASLSWLGSVLGHRVSPLGVERFGQTGSLPDLYREYRLDSEAIVEAAAELFLD